jgi:xanthine dehydrogenase accessory factor
LIEALNTSDEAQILVTCLNGSEGNIKEFKRKICSSSLIIINHNSASHNEVTSIGENISLSEDSIQSKETVQDKEAILSAQDIREVLLSGSPKYFTRDDISFFAEPFYKKERVIIFGGGHVAIPLVKFAKLVGFYVVVVDDRRQFAYPERFPEADEVLCGSFSECIQELHPGKSDYNIIITRGHKHDSLCIRELMRYEESIYTGLIGSRRRTTIVLHNLAEEGYDNNRLQRICTPIGLPIGAVTTEEIGISIMAEIIQRKRLESNDNMAVNRSDGDDRVLQYLGQMNRPCCLITIMQTTGSVPRKAGAKMLVFDDTSLFGSIGGGCVEADVIRKGVKMIGTGQYEVVSVNLDNEAAMEEGMVCGGKMVLLLEDFQGHKEAVDEI